MSRPHSRRAASKQKELERLHKRDARLRQKLEVRPAKPRQWGTCESCEQYLPLLPETGMCGPCTFGEAATLFED